MSVFARAILILIGVSLLGCGEHADKADISRPLPFAISTHEGVEVIRSGAFEITYFDLTSSVDNLYIEEINANDGKCVVMAQFTFFTPVTMNASDVIRLRMIQMDNYGTPGPCKISSVVVGTNHGWFVLEAAGSKYSAYEIETPFGKRDLPIPEGARFVTDSAGQEHCVEWQCSVSSDFTKVNSNFESRKIDLTTINLTGHAWVYGRPVFLDKSSDFSHNSISLFEFDENGGVSCMVYEQKKDSSTWQVTTTPVFFTGTYKVTPAEIKLIGNDMRNCIGVMGFNSQFSGSLLTEDRKLYQLPSGESYISGEFSEWCRSRLVLSGGGGVKVCELSARMDPQVRMFMNAAPHPATDHIMSAEP